MGLEREQDRGKVLRGGDSGDEKIKSDEGRLPASRAQMNVVL